MDPHAVLQIQLAEQRQPVSAMLPRAAGQPRRRGPRPGSQPRQHDADDVALPLGVPRLASPLPSLALQAAPTPSWATPCPWRAWRKPRCGGSLCQCAAGTGPVCLNRSASPIAAHVYNLDQRVPRDLARSLQRLVALHSVHCPQGGRRDRDGASNVGRPCLVGRSRCLHGFGGGARQSRSRPDAVGRRCVRDRREACRHLFKIVPANTYCHYRIMQCQWSCTSGSRKRIA